MRTRDGRRAGCESRLQMAWGRWYFALAEQFASHHRQPPSRLTSRPSLPVTAYCRMLAAALIPIVPLGGILHPRRNWLVFPTVAQGRELRGVELWVTSRRRANNNSSTASRRNYIYQWPTGSRNIPPPPTFSEDYARVTPGLRW